MFFKLLFIVLIFTRFAGLTWGNGFFFHPDENNMAWAVEKISWPDFNPHFFAYGHFPLYLTYWSYQLVEFLISGGFLKMIPFSAAVYYLRFFSALFSLLTVFVGWYLAGLIFKEKKWQIVFVLLLTFCPGLIQSAHFGTTESILTFVFISLIYFSFKVFQMRKLIDVILLSLLSAFGLTTKINAVIFLLSPFLGIILGSRKRVKYCFIFVFLTVILTVAFSPYNLLNFKDFLGTLRYESGVAAGKTAIFYTRQFIDTIPVAFQITKIFPWVLGLPLFVFFCLGLIFAFPVIVKKRLFLDPKFLILNSSFLVWFLFNSFLFVKWTRFMTPVLPFLVLLVVWFLKRFFNTGFLLCFSVFLCCLPGMIFTKIYFTKDIRVTASEWINKEILPTSKVLTEQGNVIDLPLDKKGNDNIKSFDFYHLDENENSSEELNALISSTDYFLSPSRRIFANHVRLPEQFPKTSQFYQRLFNGDFGFELIGEIKIFNSFEELLLGSDLSSEETWTVFDHPTVRVFKRI